MLVEVIPKEPLSFSVFHYKNPKMQHTVQVQQKPPCPLCNLAYVHMVFMTLHSAGMHFSHGVQFFLSGKVTARQAPLDSSLEEVNSRKSSC